MHVRDYSTTEKCDKPNMVVMLKSIYKKIKCFLLQLEINTVSLCFDPGTGERPRDINS